MRQIVSDVFEAILLYLISTQRITSEAILY